MEDMPTPTDQELYAMLDSVAEADDKKLDGNLRAEYIDSLLWNAIEQLNIPTFSSNNYENHDDEFDELLNFVIENNLAASDNDDTDENSDLDALLFAQAYWEQEIGLLTRISIYMSEQHFPSGTIHTDTIKKQFMAELHAEGMNDEKWMQLIDNVLEGAPLDTSKPEDFDMMTAALEKVANIDQSPQQQLYYRMQSALGLPADIDTLPDAFDSNHIAELLDLAIEATKVTLCLPGETNQPNRHQAIHELVREFQLNDSRALSALLNLSDSYQHSTH